MAKRREPEPYREPPEAGIGGEGSPFDQSVLAPVTDVEIERGVRTALVLADLGVGRIDVRVEDGIVYLGGSLPRAEERERVLEVAAVVHGVKRIVSRFSDDSEA